MSSKLLWKRLIKHPLGALYGALLGGIALFASVPMFKVGALEESLVDLAMAGILIYLMLRTFFITFRKPSSFAEKCWAWGMLILANVLALLPTHDFPGSLSTAFAFTLLICAFVLYFSGFFMAAVCIAPALWCCVFMPYHEEFMLLLSFPLRLSATTLSGWLLNLCGINVVYSGTSMSLPGLELAITDACSGIGQLDAFLLVAFIAVRIMHKNIFWQVLHFAFIIPSIIVGNCLRIVLTVLMYRIYGDPVLVGSWHVSLGYVQIVLALLIFLGIGRIFHLEEKKSEGETPCSK